MHGSARNRLARILQAIVPRPVFIAMYGLNACAACIRILLRRYGFARSALRWQSVDGDGEAIPWLTYPSIEYLEQLDFSACRVLEYGAGMSTVFWSKKSASVTAIEDDPGWYAKLKDRLPANVELLLAASKAEYVKACSRLGLSFDIIVIDGSWRVECASESAAQLADGGLVVLDDADDYPDVAGVLRARGLIEIDLAGFSPINSYTKTTSLFLHPSFRPRYRSAQSPAHSVGHPSREHRKSPLQR